MPGPEVGCAQRRGTRGQTSALPIANPCWVLTARNEKTGERIRPGRSKLYADDGGKTAGEQNTAWMGDQRAAGGGRHTRMRGARLGKGPGRPSRPRARGEHREAG